MNNGQLATNANQELKWQRVIKNNNKFPLPGQNTPFEGYLLVVLEQTTAL